MTAPTFAVIGAAGYAARRHFAAIRAVGGTVVAACDPSDSVGHLDEFGFDVEFFRSGEEFWDWVNRDSAPLTIVDCSPSNLHSSHVVYALRSDLDVICEKPVALSVAAVDLMIEMEQMSQGRTSAMLQLRLHPVLLALKANLDSRPDSRHKVSISVVAARGKWYAKSWKGDPEKSGGIVMNIGVHVFDMLLWLFGASRGGEVFVDRPDVAAGALDLERADVTWSLSTRPQDLPAEVVAAGGRSFRALDVDGTSVRFDDMTNLHEAMYREILAGRGVGIAEARKSIRLVEEIRSAAS